MIRVVVERDAVKPVPRVSELAAPRFKLVKVPDSGRLATALAKFVPLPEI